MGVRGCNQKEDFGSAESTVFSGLEAIGQENLFDTSNHSVAVMGVVARVVGEEPTCAGQERGDFTEKGADSLRVIVGELT
jgi:hypothetical protein